MHTKTHKYRALMVGCGKMGGALLRQWVSSDLIHFTVVDPVASGLAEEATLHSSIDSLEGERFDILIVAIKPQLIDTVLPDYIHHLSSEGVVLSMAAGCSVERLSKILHIDAVVRIMPNLPSFIGQGMTGIFATDAVKETYRTLIERTVSLAGGHVWVDTEDGIDRITAVAGSGPGYVFEFARVYVEAAQSLGFTNQQARDLVLGTLAGTIEMAQQSDQSLETLRDNVTSKNGTTDAGLRALNGDSLLTRKLNDTVDAAYKRAVELR